MKLIWHTRKLPDMHLWAKYVNIYAIHEVVPINDVARTGDDDYNNDAG